MPHDLTCVSRYFYKQEWLDDYLVKVQSILHWCIKDRQRYRNRPDWIKHDSLSDVEDDLELTHA